MFILLLLLLLLLLLFSFDWRISKTRQDTGVKLCMMIGIYERSCKSILLTLGAHAQRGLRYLVCLSVCLTLILELQATKRHANGTLVFSATSARKIMWPIWLKRLRSGKRHRHRPGPSFVTQPINYRGAHAYLLHMHDWLSAARTALPRVLRCCKCYFKCR